MIELGVSLWQTCTGLSCSPGVRRGQYGGEGANGALGNLSDEITQFTLDQSDPLSLPPLRLHIDLPMPVSTCSYVGKPHGQIQFSKYLQTLTLLLVLC